MTYIVEYRMKGQARRKMTVNAGATQEAMNTAKSMLGPDLEAITGCQISH